MTTFWLALAAVGVVLLLAQLVLGAAGLDADLDVSGDGHDVALTDGLQFLSVRSLAAAAAVAGVIGWGLTRSGWPLVAVAAVALLAGAAAAVGVALLVRQLLRLQQDRSIRERDLVRATGVVYLEVPGQATGLGKVHLTVRQQLIEMDAVTDFDALPAGTAVAVIDASQPDRVRVVALPSDKDLLRE